MRSGDILSDAGDISLDMSFFGVLVLGHPDDEENKVIDKIDLPPIVLDSDLTSSVLYSGIMNLYEEYHLPEDETCYDSIEGTLISSKVDPGQYAHLFHKYIAALNLGAKPLVEIDGCDAYYVVISTDGEIELVFLSLVDHQTIFDVVSYIESQKVYTENPKSNDYFKVIKVKVVCFC